MPKCHSSGTDIWYHPRPGVYHGVLADYLSSARWLENTTKRQEGHATADIEYALTALVAGCWTTCGPGLYACVLAVLGRVCSFLNALTLARPFDVSRLCYSRF